MADGKVVIVTGGTYGIGRGITMELAQRGYRVVAFGLDSPQPFSQAAEGTEGTRRELAGLGLTADVMEADVSRNEDVDRVVQYTMEKHGRIDGLVNNAAIHALGTILETSEELWDKAFAVNLKGVYFTCKAVIPHMIAQGGGSIVNVSSPAAYGWPGRLSYSATKGGMLALSFSLAYDHYHDHIRVNVIQPGGQPITGMTESFPNAQNEVPTATVAGRRATAEDHGKAVAYLLSDDAAVLSGVVIDVGRFANQGGRIPQRQTAAASLPA